MTSTGPVGIGDKILLVKFARAAITITGPVGSGTRYIYWSCPMTSTGPVGVGDKILMVKFVRVARPIIGTGPVQYALTPCIFILLSHDQHRTGGLGDKYFENNYRT